MSFLSKVPSGFTEAWEIVKVFELVGTNGRTYRVEVQRSLDPADADQPYGTACWLEEDDENGNRVRRSVAAGIMFPAASADEAASVAIGGLGIHESQSEGSGS